MVEPLWPKKWHLDSICCSYGCSDMVEEGLEAWLGYESNTEGLNHCGDRRLVSKLHVRDKGKGKGAKKRDKPMFSN